MPNHIANVLEFSSEHLDKVMEVAMTDGNLDFRKLVPVPNNVYQGSLKQQDQDDFPLNWYDWNLEQWGTKWNAYRSSLVPVGDRQQLHFTTANSIPRPAVAAFSNLLNIPFSHRYFDEGHLFWGKEYWGYPDRWSDTCENMNTRTYAHQNQPHHFTELCMELQGYHPNPPDFTMVVGPLNIEPRQTVEFHDGDEEDFHVIVFE